MAKALKKRGNKRAQEKESPNAVGQEHRFRIRVVLFLFLVIYLGIGARLVIFQIDPDLRFSEGDLKHIGEIQIHRPRGDIFDRNARVLATDREVFSLSVNPSKVENPDSLARYLAPRLSQTEDWVRKRLTRIDASGKSMKSVFLKRRMTDRERVSLGAITDAPEPNALILEKESIRYYPEAELAAHVLGFANQEGQGGEGLELRYDKYLFGKPGRRVSRVDNKRNMLGYRTLVYEPPTGGDDVHLTIDTALQHTLEQELENAIAENQAKRAMGVIMDPDTGAILALATYPAFDPNQYMDYEPEARRNRAAIDIFEPGSAFKIVTAAAALEHGLITPNELIDCMGGKFNPYGRRIPDTHPLDVVPFSEAFAASSNIAITKVAALLGPERLEEWIRRFGFGEPTALRLAGESAGILRPHRKWSRLSMGALPMGQEVAVTMLQLAKAFSVIANDGYLVEPYLVEKVVSQEGRIHMQHEANERPRILSEQTARTMQELCHLVITSENGTGSAAAIPEYRVGGKTGTAQIAKPGGGGYYKDRYTAVFAGFAPIADPRLTCVIVVQEPMGKYHWGGAVCGPVFSKVMNEALVRLGVPADPMKDSDLSPQLAARKNRPEFEFALMEPSVFDEDLDGLELTSAEGDIAEAGPRLPSLIGMTKYEAKQALVGLGLGWDPRGAGRVIRQIPPAGTPLDNVRTCKLEFSNRPRDRDDV